MLPDSVNAEDKEMVVETDSKLEKLAQPFVNKM